MQKIQIEIEWEDDKKFDIDRALDLAWRELAKCEKVDVITRRGRTCYAE